MDEIQKFLELDEQIVAKQKLIEQLKNELTILKGKQGLLGREILGMFDEGVNSIDDGGIRLSRRRGAQRVELKENITVLSLPDNFIKKSPDKNAIRKSDHTQCAG